MRRGTTPRQTFIFSDIDITDAKDIEITYSQNDTIIFSKTLSDLTVDDNTVSFLLTQEETLALNNSPVEIQVRLLTSDDIVLASRIFRVPVLRILNESVLGAEG